MKIKVDHNEVTRFSFCSAHIAAFLGVVKNVNFKKFLDKKWNFLQYLIIILASMPAILSAAYFAVINIRNFNGLSLLLAIISLALGIFFVAFPMLVRKRWVYTWGFALYFLLVTFVLGTVISAVNNMLCGSGPDF